jgi:hypothetical protein
MILTGFLVAPRVPFTTTAVAIEGNGRRGREAGNDGFRIGRGRADCRDGEVGEASGDETRGRLVLIASDMGVLVGYGCGMNTGTTGTRVRCGRRNLGIFEWRCTCREGDGEKREKVWGKGARLFKRMYAGQCSLVGVAYGGWGYWPLTGPLAEPKKGVDGWELRPSATVPCLHGSLLLFVADVDSVSHPRFGQFRSRCSKSRDTTQI